MTPPTLVEDPEFRVSLCASERMIDAYLTFAKAGVYLNHPAVPYHGSFNGDSPKNGSVD